MDYGDPIDLPDDLFLERFPVIRLKVERATPPAPSWRGGPKQQNILIAIICSICYTLIGDAYTCHMKNKLFRASFLVFLSAFLLLRAEDGYAKLEFNVESGSASVDDTDPANRSEEHTSELQSQR